MKRFGWLVVALVSLGLLSGCGSTPKTGVEGDQAGLEAGKDGKGLGRVGGNSSNLNDPSRQGAGSYHYDVNVEPEHRVYFEYNSALINDRAAQVLAHNAGWILAHGPKGTLTIEGHCDERGTREYNLALGQQRADAVVHFLVAQGLPANRLKAVSYGKERPLVPSHDEAAWSKNRRGEIVLR
ncbi:MAG: peptidoglycan-associated lipoprotein Pal [Magnetococcales bacterium]|nr:peptidoglycan-associated lipoprotein Pal [Magnetococcales bacterium]